MTFEIPIIDDLAAVSKQQIDLLKKTGFCYIKIPSTESLNTIRDCLTMAADFFKLPFDEKQIYSVDTLPTKNNFQGYSIQEKLKNVKQLERIFLNAYEPFGPFETKRKALSELMDCYINKLTKPMITSVLDSFDIDQQEVSQVTEKVSSVFVFQKFPGAKSDSDVRFDAHKDFGLITFVYSDKPGLEVFHDEQWHPLEFKPEYFIVNMGNTLEQMTDGQCHSALHRVRTPAEDRRTVVLFINPNPEMPIKNYINNTVVSESGQAFINSQYEYFFDDSSEK